MKYLLIIATLLSFNALAMSDYKMEKCATNATILLDHDRINHFVVNNSKFGIEFKKLSVDGRGYTWRQWSGRAKQIQTIARVRAAAYLSNASPQEREYEILQAIKYFKYQCK